MVSVVCAVSMVYVHSSCASGQCVVSVIIVQFTQATDIRIYLNILRINEEEKSLYTVYTITVYRGAR